MASILHFFDFGQASSTRKLLAHKRHNDGLEAPRNSLEFPVEASLSYHAPHDDIPYSCEFKEQSSRMASRSNGTPMKKLIDEEMSSKRNTRRNASGVVARLMGMDTLPSEISARCLARELNNEKVISIIPRKDPTVITSTQHVSRSSSSYRQTKQDLIPYGTDQHSTQYARTTRMTKPQPREHPQEELLQKFKKEFEAWQASMAWECSRTIEEDFNLPKVKDRQVLPQGNRHKGKMPRNTDIRRNEINNKPIELMEYVSTPTLRTTPKQEGGSQCARYVDRHRHYDFKNDKASNRIKHLPLSAFSEKRDRSSSPTRIVILKPSSEWGDTTKDSCFGSSEVVEKEDSMEDFLEEVRQKLRVEIQGKSRSDVTTKPIVRETLARERSAVPKQIARSIAKQIRESVTQDLGTTLMRSESTRSYSSNAPLDGQDSTEFINRDTRRLLSERLKNVLQSDTEVQIPLGTNEGQGSSLLTREGLRSRPTSHSLKQERKASYWEDKKAVSESKIRSFRRGHEKVVLLDAEAVSPRNLVRSYSAPVTGTAFAKLLLEDQHLSTGAHIRRKHEAPDLTSREVQKSRKDVFNLKDKVSYLKQNLTLKGKLFGKKGQSKYVTEEFDAMKSIFPVPLVAMNNSIIQDNATEVPPSPASVSSCCHDDFYGPGHPSPVSPLEVPLIEENHSPQDSGELSLNVPAELVSLLEQADCRGSEEMAIEGKPCQDEAAEVEGHAECYIRDILIAAELYHGKAFDQVFLRWDALGKPISRWVFEEVEETHTTHEKPDDGRSLLCLGDTNLSSKMLFDLVNEALPKVIGNPTNQSTFKKWSWGRSIVPHGKRLVDDLWNQIRVFTGPFIDESHSLDSMVAWDLKMTPWSGPFYEDIDVMGREIELMIVGELIDEIVCEI